MKNFIITFALLLSAAISSSALAQSQFGDNGTFWVVETQKGVKYSQIKIYDNDHNLLYNHELIGKRLNSTKRKDKNYINLIHQSFLAGHLPTIWKDQKAEVIKP
ncbi:hypothetical protein [Pararhodonellum marinum]|uniref:hypothetical protein n=1 Tax=Pararhodonellum marinum TaxID=2755358 RepID=UPI00188EA1E7|nr:hypothetical protein [Pararhodonellum marinum]